MAISTIPREGLQPEVTYSVQPAGAIMMFAGPNPPIGWLKANGAIISRTVYADLFNAIGVYWGAGDGSTTFQLPDLRGEFLRCWDDGRGVDSGRALGTYQEATRVMGQIFGVNYGYGGRVGSDSDLTDNSDPGGGAVNVSNWGDLWNGVASPAGVQFYRNTARTRPRNRSVLACIKY